MTGTGRALAAMILMACAAAGRAGEAPRMLTIQGLDERLRAVAALPGEPSRLDSMGVTRGDLPMRCLESRERPDGPRRRLVLVAGLDGDDRSVSAAIQAVRWFKTDAPAALREAWSIALLPCGNPEGWVQSKPTNNSFGKPTVNYPPQDGFFQDRKNVEARYIWRWIAFQGPDLVLDIQGGNRTAWRVPPAHADLGAGLKALPLVSPDTLEMALSQGAPSGLGTVPALLVETRESEGPAVLRAALEAGAALPRSPMRQALARRLAREPLAVAGMLAQRYPQSAALNYISGLAWAQALRLSRLNGDASLREKARRAATPFLSGAQPALPEQPGTALLGGYALFADLAAADGDAAAKKIALDAAALYRPEAAGEPARLGRMWTDDMFMTHTLLGRAGRLSGDGGYFALIGSSLTPYISRLQRADGLFVHAPDAPHCWGRGNGFAALGLVEALTYLPQNHPARAGTLASFRKQMAALRTHQAPDGTWRQVIDRPESYREVTATAMGLAAMARGLRMGWLGAEYRPVVDAAWTGLSARIAEDGGLADVCDGTGAGPTLRYYYERPAVFGHNDRGGAMALLAAVEMVELRRAPPGEAGG